VVSVVCATTHSLHGLAQRLLQGLYKILIQYHNVAIALLGLLSEKGFTVIRPSGRL
jgi:hypothetical protein